MKLGCCAQLSHRKPSFVYVHAVQAIHSWQRMKKIRVIAVDDNPAVTDAVLDKLELEPGFECVGCLDSADELVEQSLELQPDVILLDLEMPGKNALEALYEVCQAVPTVRVVILSSYSEQHLVDKAVENGAWGYLNKSASPDDIVQAIRKVAAGVFFFGPLIVAQLRRSLAAAAGSQRQILTES